MKTIKMETIENISSRLGLKADLSVLWGLDTHIKDIESFTSAQISKIAITRTLCQSADIYLLDKPF